MIKLPKSTLNPKPFKDVEGGVFESVPVVTQVDYVVKPSDEGLN